MPKIHRLNIVGFVPRLASPAIVLVAHLLRSSRQIARYLLWVLPLCRRAGFSSEAWKRCVESLMVEPERLASLQEERTQVKARAASVRVGCLCVPAETRHECRARTLKTTVCDEGFSVDGDGDGEPAKEGARPSTWKSSESSDNLTESQ